MGTEATPGFIEVEGGVTRGDGVWVIGVTTFTGLWVLGRLKDGEVFTVGDKGSGVPSF